MRRMAHAFGPQGRADVVVRLALGRSAQKNQGSVAVLHVQRGAAWTVASWLVAHAQAYGLHEVRYAGYAWKAANRNAGWQRDASPTSPSGKSVPQGGIVAG